MHQVEDRIDEKLIREFWRQVAESVKVHIERVEGLRDRMLLWFNQGHPQWEATEAWISVLLNTDPKQVAQAINEGGYANLDRVPDAPSIEEWGEFLREKGVDPAVAERALKNLPADARLGATTGGH